MMLTIRNCSTRAYGRTHGLLTSKAASGWGRSLALLACWWMAGAASAQSMGLIQATALRATPEAAAPIAAELASGSQVQLLQMRGGWAQVRMGNREGWVRASMLALPGAAAATAARLETGRREAGAVAVTLGVRSLTPRITRHALIIGAAPSRGAPAAVGSVAGAATAAATAATTATTTAADEAYAAGARARLDQNLNEALAMASVLQVPPDQISLLREQGASAASIRAAVADLAKRVADGDRVFVYWSGPVVWQAVGGGATVGGVQAVCTQSLVTHDASTLSEAQWAQALAAVAAKADKLMVLQDGSEPAPAKVASDAVCAQPLNAALEAQALQKRLAAAGLPSQDLAWVQVGVPGAHAGLGAHEGATAAISRCLQGEARDTDGSGAVSVQEVLECAQPRTAQRLLLAGNAQWVPAWPAKPAPAVAPKPGELTADATAPSGAQTPVDPQAVRSLLAQVHAQRDSRRQVQVALAKGTLRIGYDELAMSISSSHAGHVYIAMLGTDGKTLVLLFPNGLDADNRIAAGQSLTLPRPQWRMKAGGPAGEDQLLVLITERPRALEALGSMPRMGPFMRPLADAAGRSRLQWLLGQSADEGSDAFGSALVSVKEE